MNNPKISKTAGDDWFFTFTYKNKNGVALPLTDTKPLAFLTSKMDGDREIEINDSNNGAVLLDQENPDTVGKFTIRVARDITSKYELPVSVKPALSAAARSANPVVTNVIVNLRIVLEKEGNRETQGSVVIEVLRR